MKNSRYFQVDQSGYRRPSIYGQQTMEKRLAYGRNLAVSSVVFDAVIRYHMLIRIRPYINRNLTCVWLYYRVRGYSDIRLCCDIVLSMQVIVYKPIFSILVILRFRFRNRRLSENVTKNKTNFSLKIYRPIYLAIIRAF